MNRTITISQPRTLVFGNGCSSQFVKDFASLGLQRLFVVTAPPIMSLVQPLMESLKKTGVTVSVWDGISAEPTIETLEKALKAVRRSKVDAVLGIGGGSVLDVAKLVAVLHDSNQNVRDIFGTDKLSGRKTYLVCSPTTAGTGSEVSPNAILLDETDQLKKGVVSPHLMPDAVYVNPLLTKTLPPALTASTGMDALTHCIEAYANRFAHPMIDLYALEGIRLIGANLKLVVENGADIEARAKMSLGSLYGGLCLGPVCTGGVHALSYPLGGEFHIPHGVANALLLPYVLEFNIPAAPDRYARIAVSLGVKPGNSDLETARRGLERIKQLSRECSIPTSLSKFGVPREAIERMAKSAMNVTRLLKNNLREISRSDAEKIYRGAY